MEKQLLERFVGKPAKLVYGDRHFCLWGTIDAVSSDFIVFSTNEKTSLINIGDVKEIVPL